jgi:hypothetical protein
MTLERLHEMVGRELEAVTGRISDAKAELRAEMTRRFDRMDLRVDDLRSEVKGEIAELKQLIRANVKGRKRSG